MVFVCFLVILITIIIKTITIFITEIIIFIIKQFELDSVIRADMSFLAAEKRTTLPV